MCTTAAELTMIGLVIVVQTLEAGWSSSLQDVLAVDEDHNADTDGDTDWVKQREEQSQVEVRVVAAIDTVRDGRGQIFERLHSQVAGALVTKV